jgi:hypothetical protein
MPLRNRPIGIFLLLWLLVNLLYGLAWRSGFVTDAVDWISDLRGQVLGDYLNRKGSTIHALYQLTQLTTLGIYRIFGTNRLAWHLIMTGLQALNGLLLYRLIFATGTQLRLKRLPAMSWIAAILFCSSPYLGEPLIWKACFHYLQGMAVILACLLCMTGWMQRRKAGYAVAATLLMLAGSFALELFYLIPAFSLLTLAIIYRGHAMKRAAMLRFVVPQALVLVVHLIAFHLVYGEWFSHGTAGGLQVKFFEHLSKGFKYLFHLLAFGRFWPQELKAKVYRLSESPGVLAMSYAALILAFLALVWKTLRGRQSARLTLLLVLFLAGSLVLALPMPLDELFDLNTNRYLYAALPWFSALLAIGLTQIPRPAVRYALLAIWVLPAAALSLRTARHWQTGTKISDRLLEGVPAAGARTRLLMSLPYAYKGIPMINAFPAGNFRRMHDALFAPPLQEPSHDVAAFNMAGINDGAEAQFVNDSTIKVTLLQWGTWWWYKDFGAYSYETPDYRVDMRDQGHWYELILKRPAEQYQLLYSVGGEWRELKR